MIFSETLAQPAHDLGLPRGLVTEIAPGDGMYSGVPQYYFQAGRSALDCIELALRCAVKDKGRVRAIADFGCGFGRVTRWLVAAFPEAQVTAMDVDPKAIAAVSSLLPVTTQIIDRAWKTVPRDRYDLIWCGSLLTHIGREKSQQLFALLYERLAPGGVLTATTHGTYVAERLRRREKTYRLSNADTDELLGAYDSADYGFQPYAGETEYGISVCKPHTALAMGSAVRLTPLVFFDRGWMRHQDFMGFCR